MVNETVNNLVNTYGYQTRLSWNSCKPTTTSFRSGAFKQGTYYRRNGNSVYRFRELISRAANATGTYSRIGYTIRRSGGEGFLLYKQGFCGKTVNIAEQHCNGHFIGDPTASSLALSGLQAEASAAAAGQFYEEYRSATGALAGATLAEGQKTLKELSDIAKYGEQWHIGNWLPKYQTEAERLMKSLFRSGLSKKQRAKRIGRFLSDQYLRYQYGIKPLIADTRSIAESFAEWQIERPMRKFQGFGSAESSVCPSTVAMLQPPGSNLYASLWETQTARAWAKYRGAVISANQGASLGSLGATLGFSWESFVPTVWELVPYSFILDYFTNIGDVLSAGLLVQSHLAWGCASSGTTKTKEISGNSNVARMKSSLGSQFISGYYYPGTASREDYSFQRSRIDSIPIPPYVCRFPGIRQFFNTALIFNQGMKVSRTLTRG